MAIASLFINKQLSNLHLIPVAFHRRITMKNKIIGLTALVSALSMANISYADVPNTFASGEPAVASEINENFSDLDGRITSLENVTGDSSTTTINVDCSVDTVSSALASAPAAGPLLINVTGRCTDTIVIERSNISIIGTDTGATINYNTAVNGNAFDDILSGVINVVGAQNIVIDNLTLINYGGGGIGLHAQAGSSVAVNNSTFENAYDGIVVQHGSNIKLTGSTVHLNTRSGLFISDQSNIQLASGNTITQTPHPLPGTNSWGVLVGRNSNMSVSGSGNNITNNTTGGTNTWAIEVFQGGGFRANSGDLIVNGDASVTSSAHLELRSVALTGNVMVGSKGTLRLNNNGNTISLVGDVNIDALGTVLSNGESTITGDVTCLGDTLSYYQTNPTVSGTIDASCTTF